MRAGTVGRALAAGVSGVLALWALYAVFRPLIPASSARVQAPDLPTATAAVLIIVGAAVTAVAEEAGFRGYMQVPLETRYGPVPAISIVSIVFMAAHFTHGWPTLWLSPFYLAISVVYGLLAYSTGSILVPLGLHFAGDVALFGIRYSHVSLDLPAGIGPSRVLLAAGAAIFATGSVFSFRSLLRSRA